MQAYVRHAAERQREIVSTMREMVECESPSDSARDVDRFVDLVVERTRDIAAAQTVAIHARGKALRLEFQLPGAKKSGRILALGHADTVWPLGALASMPFRESGGRLWGPGVLDMKAGLAFFIHAVRTLRELDVPVNRSVVLLIVPDEETGSFGSRELTEAEARQSQCALVLEPGTGLDGKAKTARKGVGRYRVTVRGRAAHAGLDFEQGANAIVELSRQIGQIVKFTNLRRGITLSPGVITGGTRSNVVPAEATLDVDLRVLRRRDAQTVEEKFRALRVFDERCELHIEGGLDRPPMERSRAIAALYRKAKSLAAEIGVDLQESVSGGGSDGNFTAALGIPTLDGIGAVGEGAHAENESILVSRIADRTALLAGLIAIL